MITKNAKATTAVTAAEAAVAEARAAADAAKARHVEIYGELTAAKAEMQRIDAALRAGDTTLDPEAMVAARHAVETKRALNNAASRAHEAAKTRLGEAEGALIAERIKAESGGFRSRQAITAEVEKAVESFIEQLDKIASKVDEKNTFLHDAYNALLKYDGGKSPIWHTPDSIGGVQRTRSGSTDGIQVDGQFLSPVLTEVVVYKTAAQEIERAGLPQVRARRRNG